MTTSLFHEGTHSSANNRIDRHAPPSQPNNTHRQALPVHPARDSRAQRPSTAANALPKAMDSAQHGGMWAAIVDEDASSGEGERAGQDLQSEDSGDAYPDPRAVGGGRRPRRRRQQHHVRRHEVRHWEQQQRQPERARRAQPRRQRRVQRQLQADPDRAQDRERDADSRGRH